MGIEGGRKQDNLFQGKGNSAPISRARIRFQQTLPIALGRHYMAKILLIAIRQPVPGQNFANLQEAPVVGCALPVELDPDPP
jgi:hypothetical protein